MRSAFSVTKALKAAAGFLPQAWAGAWLALILLFAVVVGVPLVLSRYANLLPMPLAAAPLIAVFLILLVKLVAQGALYRIALFGNSVRTQDLGFGGVQIARPELRLLLASLVVAAFIAVIAATLFVVFAIALSLSGLAAGYENSLAAVCAMVKRHAGIDYLFLGYIAAAGVFMLFVALKFVLMPAANIAGSRLVTLNALGLSSGNVGKLFLGLVALVLPFAVIYGLAARHFGPEILLAYLLPHAFGPADRVLALHAGMQALSLFVLLPLVVGFLASAYRQIVANRSK